jgi:polysaccharide deacetylase 2 family uncharacterized protein YibQ
MIEQKAAMDRRDFLCKSVAFSIGSLLGLNTLSNAFACETIVRQPKIALIIDDIGFSRSRLEMFLSLETVLTFAVLPRLPRSLALSEEIHSLGYEIMLHQPMEPADASVDPGPGAVYVGDDEDKIGMIMEENISEFPFARGINNHMGSRFTAFPREMADVIKTLKGKGLFFVDSLTTNHSTGYQTAKSLNVAAARRNIFLDNSVDISAIMAQLDNLKSRALRTGYAIGIGHPFPETAAAIALFKISLMDSNIQMVRMSELIPS